MKIEQSNTPFVLDARIRARALSQRSEASRKGSALLIVIGTLALMSVFAAVYISVGRTDRRAANAVKVRVAQQNISQNFGEALSTVIGNDRLDAFVQWNGIDPQDPFGLREVTDAPYTDWTRRSESLFVDGRDLFTPVGGPFSIQNLNQGNDFSVASDPWLASTTPVYLGNPGNASAGITDRPFSTYLPFETNYPNAKNFLDNRDWLQISNFAPDGRFVNLVNLRPNSYSGFDGLVDGDIGGFSAQSGTGVSEDPADGRRIRRMSNYLSLWKMADPTNPESLIQTQDPANGGFIWFPGQDQNSPVTGILPINEIANTPAVWTMYQRFMYMPMNQPFQTLNRNGQVSSWADPDYPAYQYADADGDGMADSRWFELTAARDKVQGDSDQTRTDIEVMYDRKDYRFFLAARAVDLSSMVNVNTATDLLVPPTREYPLGLTPADVDLRRLLTMQDAAGDYTANNTHNLPLSYAQLHRPYIGEVGVEPRFGPWIPSAATGWEQRNLNRNVTDYWLYKHEYDRAASGGSGDLRELENSSTSMLVGRYAYDALRQGIMLGNSLSGAYEGFDYAYQMPSERQHLLQYERDPSDIGMIPARITAQKRIEQYRQVGQLDPTNLGTSLARGTDFGSGLYGMDDLVELLTFHGLNDPEVTTRLERVTTGRYRSPNADTLQTQRFGPLMSNRPLSLDRQQHGMALIDITNDPSTAPSATDRELRAPNGRISFNSMAHMALTPRNKLTTISGAVPLVPTGVVENPSRPEALTQLLAASDLAGILSNANQLFGLYTSSLAGALDTPETFFADATYWPTDVNLFQNQLTSTLFYGHRGPELALRIAAHTAVNMADMMDSNTDPTIATVIVDNDRGQVVRDYFNNDLASGGGFDPVTDPEYTLYPGIADGNLFDPGVNTLPNGNLPDKRQAVNVYGFEAMPVLTEVSVLYAYTDASDRGGGGDKDYFDSVPIIRRGVVIYPRREDIDEISINGDVSPGNADFLIQVLAFQLHNPYDQDISLGGSSYNGTPLGGDEPLTRQRAYQNEENAIDPTSNYQFDYYIEFAGRFFKVAKYIEWYPTVNNAENYTVVDASSAAYTSGSVPSPEVDFPLGHTRMEPGTQTSAGATPGNYTNQAPYSDFITRNVVLRAGETRVFYVIADKRFDDATPGNLTDGSNPDDRWARSLDAWEAGIPAGFTNLVPGNDLDLDGLPDGPGGDPRGWTGPAEQWVEHQFRVMNGGTGIDPVMMMEFDPRDGKLLNETGFEDLTTPSASPLFPAPILGRTDALEVRLWKKIVTRGEETVELSSADIPNPTKRNVVANDLLVDRMILGESLASPIASGDFKIVDTVSYREDFPVPGSEMDDLGVRNDNTGVTIAAWKTNRRADSDTQEPPSIGEVVPWMLRSSAAPGITRQSLVSFISGTPVASDIFDGDDLTDPAEAVTIAGDFEISQSLLAFFNLSLANGANAIIQTIALAPHLKNDVTAQAFVEDDAANDSIGKFPPLILTVQDPANDIVPEILVNGATIKDTPRLADLLLAWGIGPAFSPSPVRVNRLDYVPEEWMTGPEAMATALGINAPNPAGPLFDDIDSIWKDTYDLTIGDVVLDNGHLAIDNYVSYVNTDLNIPPTFDPVVDIPRGTGVPMALGVIDHARAIAPIPQVSDPSSPTPDQILRMALGRATFGTVNINTAPIEVLRLLPGLTPSRAQYISGGMATNAWWGKDFAGTKLPPLTNPPLGSGTLDDLADNPDVAAAIIAYRDRTYGIPNTAARPEPYGLNFYDNAPMNLGPTDPQLFANNMRGEYPTILPLPVNSNAPVDRSAMTGIDGIRSTPGFGSLGELLAVRIDPALEVTDPTRWNILKHLSIQQYGFDEEASGIESDVTIMSQLFNGTSTGTTKDDYAEKISMANSVLNTISVRSDYFAVWFVVHGYQESDVKNLRPEDPLVPSIKKRFLMVVDRTNVIEPGDKPNILVFKELPY